MTRVLTLAALVTLVVLPTALAVPSQTSPSPAQQCKQLQATMSAADFASAMGASANPKAAFGKCVAMKQAQAQQNAQNAAQACKAERAAEAAKFAETYGRGKNAYGKCVSTKAREATEEQQSSLLNAAKACKAERAGWNAADHGGKTFAQHYGTNKNLKNAFGKCVSTKAKAKQQS